MQHSVGTISEATAANKGSSAAVSSRAAEAGESPLRSPADRVGGRLFVEIAMRRPAANHSPDQLRDRAVVGPGASAHQPHGVDARNAPPVTQQPSLAACARLRGHQGQRSPSR